MMLLDDQLRAAEADKPIMLRILVVEDDFGDYDAVARALKKMVTFTAMVTRAKTLESARKLMREYSYDVLMIDYNLGVECGARLLDEVGGRGGRAVPILLSGLMDRKVHEAALRAGVITCISKSDLSPSLLETTIRSSTYTHQLEFEFSLLVRTIEAGDLANAQAMLKLVHERMPWIKGGPR